MRLPTGPLYKYLSTAPGLSPSWEDRFLQLICGLGYYASPRAFNDPFDCLPHMVIPTGEALAASRSDFARRLAASVHHLGYDFASAEASALEALKLLSAEELQEKVFESTAKTAAEMGVFCLTENIDNVLMWSHYANNHSGIALRFDWRKQLTGGLMPLFPVTYQDHRPEVADFYSGASASSITGALSTKASFWSYEKEWRSFRPNEAGTTVQFKANVVDAVLFGVNCKPEHEAWIRSVVGDRPMTFLKATPAKRTFQISFYEI